MGLDLCVFTLFLLKLCVTNYIGLCCGLHKWAMRGPMGLVGSVCPYIVSVAALCYKLHGIVLSTSVFTHISTHSHQYTPVSIEHRYRHKGGPPNTIQCSLSTSVFTHISTHQCQLNIDMELCITNYMGLCCGLHNGP